MGGSSKKVTVGYRYSVGMQMVLCHGPIDQITEIKVDDRRAWIGIHQGGRLSISAPALFGGDSREGGVIGEIDLEMGEPDQLPNSYLQAQLGSLVPAFRGVVSAILRQVYVGNNPYLKPWAFRAQRVHVRQNGLPQWYGEKAGISSRAPDRWGAWSDDLDGRKDPIWNGQGQLLSEGGDQFVRLTGDAALAFTRSLSEVGPYKRMIVRYRIVSSDPDESEPLLFGFSDAFMERQVRIMPVAGKYTIEYENVPLTAGSQWYWRMMNVTGSLDDWVELQIEIDPSLPSGQLKLWHDQISMLASQPGHTEIGGTLFVRIDPPAGMVVDVDSVRVEPIDENGINQDMNPAHIIRECLTDPDWGMGYAESDIDDPSFTAAADALYQEGMGMSLLWEQQVPIEDFISEVLSHIDGHLFVGRTDGKFRLKLIRNDYVVGELLSLGPDQIEQISSVKRTALGDVVNSVTVNFWDQLTGDQSSVTVQDTALIQIQGAAVNTTVSYPGFTRREIASKAALRDLRALSAQLLSCELSCDRSAAQLNVGDAFVLDYPDLGISNLVMRVQGVNAGNGRTNRIQIEAVEDVFSQPDTAIVKEPEVGTWIDPLLQPPEPVDPRLIIEAPYFELVQTLGQSAADQQLSEEPTSGFLGAAGGRSGNALNAELMVDDGAEFTSAGIMDFSPFGAIETSMLETDTLIRLSQSRDADEIEVGSIAQINAELIRIDAVTEDSGDIVLTVGRGVLDTVPQIHVAGDDVIVWDGQLQTDDQTYVSGESVDVKLLTNTGREILPSTYAPTDSLTFNARAIRPYPPANVRINGAYFPDNAGAPLQIEWSHRDRRQQTDQALYDWFDGDIGPEPGVTYQLTVYNEDGAVWIDQTIDSADPASFVTDVQNEMDTLNKNPAARSGIYEYPDPANVQRLNAQLRVVLESWRDGYESWQRFDHTMQRAGYGFNYGNFYGGA